MSNMQFRLSVNRKSFPWEDVTLSNPDLTHITRALYKCTTLDSITSMSGELGDLFKDRVLPVVKRDERETTVLDEQVKVDAKTSGIVHLVCKAQIAYGDVKEARYNYTVTSTRWGWDQKNTTYNESSPCVEDVVVELRFMEN